MRILVFLLCLGVVGCAGRAVRFGSKVEPKPVLVLVPGFYGSALADRETGERYFLSLSASLFSQVPLALDEPDLGVKGTRPMREDGVLRDIPIVPLLYAYEAYGPALDFLADIGQVVPFSYDWRQDLHTTVLELDRLVTFLEKAGATSITLVGHSLGGLIVSWYLRYGTEPPETAVENDRASRRIHAAVVAAAPYDGAVTAFRNLQTGTSLGTASIPLNQISLSTMPAMYYLIPGGGDAYRGRPTGERIRTPILWEKNRWGLFRERGVPADVLERRGVASKTYLERAEKFFEKLTAPWDGVKRQDPPVLHLAGKGYETFDHVIWLGDRWNWKTPPGDGDDLVSVSSSRLPEGFGRRFHAKSLTTKVRHAGVFGEDVCRSAMTEFLNAHGSKKR